jgi:hypothetical protein
MVIITAGITVEVITTDGGGAATTDGNSKIEQPVLRITWLDRTILEV